MAAVPEMQFVTVDQYLNSSYHPDMEYVDGALVERGMPTIAHGLFEAILVSYFRAYAKQLRFAVLPNTRTEIVEQARYRIPDVQLCPVPVPAGKVVNTVPWAVIEILSPDDRMPSQLQRFRDYERIGVRHIVLLDPEELIAYRFEDGSLLRTELSSLDLPAGAVPFDTAALFRQLTEERSEA